MSMSGGGGGGRTVALWPKSRRASSLSARNLQVEVSLKSLSRASSSLRRESHRRTSALSWLKMVIFAERLLSCAGVRAAQTLRLCTYPDGHPGERLVGAFRLAGDVHALALNLIESLFAAADGLEMFGDAVLVGGKVVEGSGYRFIDGS